MSSPYSSSSAFSSPGGSTVRVFSDRVISTMQAPSHSSPSRGRGVESLSGSPSETVYFPSSQTGHNPLAARLSVLEEEVSSLRADLGLVKGKLEAQESEKRLLEERNARNVQSLKEEALRWFGRYLDVKVSQGSDHSLSGKTPLFGHDSD